MVFASPAQHRRAQLKGVCTCSAELDINGRIHNPARHAELGHAPVRNILSITGELKSIAEWSLVIGIKAAAMESTSGAILCR